MTTLLFFIVFNKPFKKKIRFIFRGTNYSLLPVVLCMVLEYSMARYDTVGDNQYSLVRQGTGTVPYWYFVINHCSYHQNLLSNSGAVIIFVCSDTVRYGTLLRSTVLQSSFFFLVYRTVVINVSTVYRTRT